MRLGISLAVMQPPVYVNRARGVLSVTNLEKLQLDPATAVGTQVSVSDGFYVSGFGDARDGFWFPFGMVDSHPRYIKFLPFVDDGSDLRFEYAGTKWTVQGSLGESDANLGAENYPWEVTPAGDWAFLTFTYPAVQQLAAPSSAQGGVVVLGGTQDGVYTIDATLNGRAAFFLLGGGGSANGDTISACYWYSNNQQWIITNVSTSQVYYSGSDVPTPDLASNWKNASDDSPAAITVTNIEQGAIDAGLAVSGAGTSAINGSFLNNGSLNTDFGPRYYYNLVGETADAAVNSVFMHSITKWTVGGSDQLYTYNGTDAFPFSLAFTVNNGNSPAPTVIRNNVATEANWTSV